MPDNRGSMKDVLEKIAVLRGRELDDEEVGEVEEWNKGRQLAQLVVMPGWSVVLEMLASYAAHALRKLSITDPANFEEVRAEHAVAFAAMGLYNRFIEDVGSAVEKSRKTPPVVKDGLRRASPAPPESMF